MKKKKKSEYLKEVIIKMKVYDEKLFRETIESICSPNFLERFDDEPKEFRSFFENITLCVSPSRLNIFSNIESSIYYKNAIKNFSFIEKFIEKNNYVVNDDELKNLVFDEFPNQLVYISGFPKESSELYFSLYNDIKNITVNKKSNGNDAIYITAYICLQLGGSFAGSDLEEMDKYYKLGKKVNNFNRDLRDRFQSVCSFCKND